MSGEISTHELSSLPLRVRRRVFHEALRQGKLRVEEPRASQRLLARGLEADLRKAVSGEVRFDPGSRALYATDGSNYRQVLIGVVVPRTAQDVLATLQVCRDHGAPFLSRGGGTSLAGQCCNVAVVADFSKYLNKVVELDPARRLARVEPGCVLDRLRDQALEHGLNFGPDPATHNHCTLGGMIGNNSCGVHSVLTGRTEQNVEALEVATYRGLRLRVGATPDDALRSILAEGGERARVYQELAALRDRYAPLIRQRFPAIPRRVSGYALPQLLPENGFNLARALTGTEATCVAILEATVALVPWPKARALLVLAFEDVYQAADAVPRVLEHRPMALEGMDHILVEHLRRKGLSPEGQALLPPGRGWLLAEFGGEDPAQAAEQARRAMQALRRRAGVKALEVVTDPLQEQKIWKTREAGLGATAFVPGEPDAWEGWEDSAVAPERLGEYLRALRALMEKHRLTSAFYGHFGDGCLHCRINFDLVSAEGVRAYRRFVEEASDLVSRLGGSYSGEHGDGQSRGELLHKLFGPELVEAFEQFKGIWDPDWKMNPGKVVRPRKLDQDLRLGPAYAPRPPATHFRFPDDQGSFVRAALRCVGIGECRKTETGTMCPSYMATREEKHSTRGRAHLLFEMMRGDRLRGLREEAVKDALDLCLACKACKHECPVNVDMATYKAEFLAGYYARRLRPRSALAMGNIDRIARLAARVPRLANLFGQSEVTGFLLKRLAGIARERRLPAFAPMTFQRWFSSRPDKSSRGRAVVLWPDTFTNFFEPDIARCAVEALEASGMRVIVPREPVCCGRPLYDSGMLGRAKALLARSIEVLRPHLRQGTPVVVLEPSCASVFRDELRGLFPEEGDALRLRQQTVLLSELLDRERDGALPVLRRRALVQAHCHHRAILGTDAQVRVMERMQLDARVLDSGCCGMAGSFGFEEEKVAVSLAVGERRLLPAVREADESELVLADGFSCREQIAQATGRRAIHLAQALALARHYGASGPLGRPENARELSRIRNARPPLRGRHVAMGALGLAVAVGLASGAKARIRGGG